MKDLNAKVHSLQMKLAHLEDRYLSMGKFLTLAEDKFSHANVYEQKGRPPKVEVFIRHPLFQFSVVKESGSFVAKLSLKPFSTSNFNSLMDNLDALNRLLKSVGGGEVEMSLGRRQKEVEGLNARGVFSALLFSRYGQNAGYATRKHGQLALNLGSIALTFLTPEENRVFVNPLAVGKVSARSPERLIDIISSLETLASKLYEERG